MNAFSIINAVFTCFFFSIGLYALLINRTSIIHRFFFLVCLSVTVWSFCAIFIFSTADKEISTLFYKISCIGFFFYFAVNLHFCIKLAGFKVRPVFFSLLYLFPLVFSIAAFVDYTVYVDFIRDDNTWIITLNSRSVWGIAYMFYMMAAVILGIACLLVWNVTSISKKIKRQSLLLVLGNIFMTMFGSIFAYDLMSIFNHSNAAFSPFFPVFWIGFAFFAISRYQFLSLTPDKIRSNILAEINDSVIFLDQNYDVLTINQRVKDLLQLDAMDTADRKIDDMVENFDGIKKEIESIKERKYLSFSCRINFRKEDKANILMDVRISLVKDKFDDIIGILIIGREVKELKQFKSRYKITDREAQIIEDIIGGKTNKEISGNLNISENTTKSHVTNIYNKLFVNNRMELLNLLKEYNLVPERSADRTVLFFDKEK